MHQVSVGYPTMHKALVFLYVYNSTLWLFPMILSVPAHAASAFVFIVHAVPESQHCGVSGLQGALILPFLVAKMMQIKRGRPLTFDLRCPDAPFLTASALCNCHWSNLNPEPLGPGDLSQELLELLVGPDNNL